MPVSSCMFLSNLVLKPHPIFIRMGDTTFCATSDYTSDVGIVHLTKAELKELTGTGSSDKGERVGVK